MDNQESNSSFSEDENFPFKCRFCKNKFRSENMLSKHKWFFHEKEENSRSVKSKRTKSTKKHPKNIPAAKIDDPKQTADKTEQNVDDVEVCVLNLFTNEEIFSKSMSKQFRNYFCLDFCLYIS